MYDIVTGIDVEKLTTDDNGEINLKDLPVGKYQLIETKAPAGYKLDNMPVKFEIIEKQKKTIILEKTNFRVTSGGDGTPTDPRTPGEPGVPGNPGDPGKPGIPGNPGDPSNPGVLSNPDTPGKSGNPRPRSSK